MPVRKCAIPTCVNHQNTGHILTMFIFPKKDPKRLKVWLDQIGMAEKDLKAWYKLCALHFEKNFLIQKAVKCRLAPNAVPTLYLKGERPPKRAYNKSNNVDDNNNKNKEVKGRNPQNTRRSSSSLSIIRDNPKKRLSDIAEEPQELERRVYQEVYNEVVLTYEQELKHKQMEEALALDLLDKCSELHQEISLLTKKLKKPRGSTDDEVVVIDEVVNEIAPQSSV